MRYSRSGALRVLAASATAPWWAATAEAQTPAAVRAAMIPIEPAALIYYALDNGYFAKGGLEVTVAQNASTPALAAAVASGTYDLAYATISTLAVAHVKGLPFVVVAPGIAGGGGPSGNSFSGGIMVLTNSPIRTAADCNGKTFGAAGLNTLAEYQPRAWIDKHGGDSTTVKFIEIPFPETIEAMRAGRIDAAYLVEPFASLAMKRGVIRMLATGDDAIGAHVTATGWYCTSAWAQAHPDAVAHFVVAMRDAARWANANQAAVIPILVKELHADPAIAGQSARPYFPDSLAPADIQPWIDVTARYAKFAPFPAAEIIAAPRG